MDFTAREMVMGAGNGRTFALSSGPAAPECAVPRPARILVVLPAYNEEANIASLLRRIFETLTDDQVGFSVIVVDDGSSDRTREILEETQREMPLIVQRHERNQGLGATLRDGLRQAAALSSPRDIIITMDADESHTPGLMLRMV